VRRFYRSRSLSGPGNRSGSGLLVFLVARACRTSPRRFLVEPPQAAKARGRRSDRPDQADVIAVLLRSPGVATRKSSNLRLCAAVEQLGGVTAVGAFGHRPKEPDAFSSPSSGSPKG
jgi:hypothetical protein